MANGVGLDRVNLRNIISGMRKIPKVKRGVFLQGAQKYGYSEKMSNYNPSQNYLWLEVLSSSFAHAFLPVLHPFPQFPYHKK